MNDTERFQRVTAVSAILAGLLAIGSAVLSLASANGDTQALMQGSIIAIGPRGAELFRWAMILDMFGYYLLLAPLALLLWDWLEPHGPAFVRLYTLCGLAYILIGSIGAVVLAAVQPELIREYAQAEGPRREMLEVVSRSFYTAVDRGLWNTLEVLLAAIWWMGIGRALRRERYSLAILTFVLGVSALLDSLGRITGVEFLYQIGVGGVLLLIPIWALWFGIDLLRRPVATR